MGISKRSLLERYREKAYHNLLCYSRKYAMTEAKPGYEKEWSRCREEYELLDEMIRELEAPEEEKPLQVADPAADYKEARRLQIVDTLKTQIIGAASRVNDYAKDKDFARNRTNYGCVSAYASTLRLLGYKVEYSNWEDESGYLQIGRLEIGFLGTNEALKTKLLEMIEGKPSEEPFTVTIELEALEDKQTVQKVPVLEQSALGGSASALETHIQLQGKQIKSDKKRLEEYTKPLKTREYAERVYTATQLTGR